MQDKLLVVEILTSSFDDNKSVNYVIRQDDKRDQRLKRLMEYSFDVCHLFGKIFLSDDKKACALIVLPEKRKTTFRSLILDMKLIMSCIGLSNMSKVLRRESKIKKLQPGGRLFYLWFIGVKPCDQNHGIGSGLLSEIIKQSEREKRTVCLETSTLKNIPWYEKFGFMIYNKLELSYPLYFMKR